jgi:hypothetical protein
MGMGGAALLLLRPATTLSASAFSSAGAKWFVRIGLRFPSTHLCQHTLSVVTPK